MSDPAEGWLPMVLCPTDGVWRLAKLADGSEFVVAFDCSLLGSKRWKKRVFAYRTPSRPTGEIFGGVAQYTRAYDTHLIEFMPEGVYPTHFRPNDTIYGDALTTLRPTDKPEAGARE